MRTMEGKAMSAKQCGNCAHFRPYDYTNSANPPDVGGGQCRRLAPPPIWHDQEQIHMIDVIWPTMEADESCGQHEPSEVEPSDYDTRSEVGTDEAHEAAIVAVCDRLDEYFDGTPDSVAIEEELCRLMRLPEPSDSDMSFKIAEALGLKTCDRNNVEVLVGLIEGLKNEVEGLKNDVKQAEAAYERLVAWKKDVREYADQSRNCLSEGTGKAAWTSIIRKMGID